MTRDEVILKIFDLWTTEDACVWMIRSNQFLGGKRPADLLDNEDGLALVAQLLGRMEAGVFV